MGNGVIKSNAPMPTGAGEVSEIERRSIAKREFTTLFGAGAADIFGFLYDGKIGPILEERAAALSCLHRRDALHTLKDVARNACRDLAASIHRFLALREEVRAAYWQFRDAGGTLADWEAQREEITTEILRTDAIGCQVAVAEIVRHGLPEW